MRLMLLDDEPHALTLMEILLEEHAPWIELIGSHTSPDQAFEAVNNAMPDVMFIDIDLPGMNGISFAKHMKAMHPGLMIVFVTAYSEYALTAFDLDSVDYLLKPVRPQRLQETLLRLKLRFDRQQDQQEQVREQPLRLQCFTSFQIFDNKRAVLKWRTQKVRELCALLLHRHPQPVRRDELIEWLWPEIGLEKAKTYLYTHLNYLRKMFEDCGGEIEITKYGAMLGLSIQQSELDVMIWKATQEQLLKQNKPVSLEQMRNWINCYGKGYFAEDDYRWANSEQSAYEDRLKNQLRDWIRLAIETGQGQWEAAAFCASELVQRDPLNEEDCRFFLMTSMALGRRTEALDHYRRFTDSLWTEYQLRPDEKTVQLYRSIERNEAMVE